MASAYGGPHKREREKWRPVVERGDGWCRELVCLVWRAGGTRWIPPGTPWDLAHDRDQGGYLGPAHARCNRAEGARYRNAGGRLAPPEPQPRTANRWVL